MQIWLNINYLVLQSLHTNYNHGAHKAQAEKIYKKLRKNIVNNMFNEYQETGYVWEQYSCEDGAGARSHPFTGTCASRQDFQRWRYFVWLSSTNINIGGFFVHLFAARCQKCPK
jgi:Glycosyl hydrolase family 63 C-terminal domain